MEFVKLFVQFNLSSNKKASSYDLQGEKQKSVTELSQKKFRKFLKYLCFDIKAFKILKITQISELTLWRIFKQLRILITIECENISKR